jgi:phage gp45-like
MRVETGVVKNFEIKKNKDGSQPVRLLQCVISDPEDVQTVEWISQAGEDSGPPKNSAVIIVSVGSTKFAIAVDDGIQPGNLPEGEKHLYSSLNGIKKAGLIFKTDGVLEINGNQDFAIRFSDLQTVFDTLAQALNTEFENIRDAITFLGGSYQPSEIEINIGTAKVSTVKLPK